MQRFALVSMLAVLMAACGTAATSVDDSEGAGSSSTSVATSTSEATPPPTSPAPSTPGSSSPSSTTTSSQAALPPLDGPAAPDFSIELSDGSTFVLSEEARPVYLVFWAEW